jgi:hypothetical protein
MHAYIHIKHTYLDVIIVLCEHTHTHTHTHTPQTHTRTPQTHERTNLDVIIVLCELITARGHGLELRRHLLIVLGLY